ncbi:hypothetical protein JMF94_05990 [Desulfovibrio sp. UIB00]|uniref:hypothetical protein n=1 Tax=Desulfovibrio sp. UIB00 TaxID=2804314 RepID=UPI001F117FDB|nr:hypothetical protein [Desulfovibrio sp. UIB00]MCH5144631.1 hypothetical protein [Desulfovibrio sp. UIB00]
MINLSDFGILISAIGGIIVIYDKLFERKDRFVVKYGSYRSEMDDRDAMFIVSKSFRPISIRDYGFIKEDGQLESIPWIGECASECDRYDIEKRGKLENMEYNQHCEIKCRTGERLVGAFAIGSTQNFPKLAFGWEVNPVKRLWIRLKIYGAAFE